MLLSTSTRLGALVANAKKDQTEAMLRFGEKLGMAFQVHDDLLGIWGNSLQTGKSISSDLDNDKKSLPVIYALEKGGQFAELWVKRSNRAIAAEEMARALEEDGAKHFAEEKAEQLTQDALSALKQTLPEDEAGSALRALAFELVQRTH